MSVWVFVCGVSVWVFVCGVVGEGASVVCCVITCACMQAVDAVVPIFRTKTVILDKALDKKSRDKILLHFIAVMKVSCELNNDFNQ